MVVFPAKQKPHASNPDMVTEKFIGNYKTTVYDIKFIKQDFKLD